MWMLINTPKMQSCTITTAQLDNFSLRPDQILSINYYSDCYNYNG